MAGISSIMNSVQKSYETDRQPETLAEASGYLNQMTGGRYQRIWTPFGESSLCVDDRDNKPICVEHLSRGTREQVFLSLRLALAAAYSRRGAGLPLILDDVFVNFDAQRARDAARTVVQFAAAGHQVLVFTCHDHIRDVFWDLGVDLRELPDAQRNAESPQPVMSSEHVEPPAPEVRLPAPTEPAVDIPEPVAVQGDLLPTDGDPELDHELLYGAPEYSPGYQVDSSSHSSASTIPRRRRRPRRTAAEARDLREVAPRHEHWQPQPVPPAWPVVAATSPSADLYWGEVAEYGEWYPQESSVTPPWVDRSDLRR